VIRHRPGDLDNIYIYIYSERELGFFSVTRGVGADSTCLQASVLCIIVALTHYKTTVYASLK